MRASRRRSSALGLVPEAASSLLAPRLMGHRRAFELLVMGKPLDGEEAKACGLVNQVAPAGEVEAEAMKAAQAIAALPPEGVAISRRLMKGAPDEIVQRIDEEAEEFRQRLQSPEARAAFRRFSAGRSSDALRSLPREGGVHIAASLTPPPREGRTACSGRRDHNRLQPRLDLLARGLPGTAAAPAFRRACPSARRRRSPGRPMAISNRMPFGSRKYRLRNQKRSTLPLFGTRSLSSRSAQPSYSASGVRNAT